MRQSWGNNGPGGLPDRDAIGCTLLLALLTVVFLISLVRFI